MTSKAYQEWAQLRAELLDIYRQARFEKDAGFDFEETRIKMDELEKQEHAAWLGCRD